MCVVKQVLYYAYADSRMVFEPQETFPDPKKLSVELHRLGFKGIWMLDPGIKVEEGYEAYDSGSQLDVWIQTATGKQYVGMFHLDTLHYAN